MDPRDTCILVTGASGFTGHHVVRAVAEAGYRVRATDLSSRHYSSMFEALGVEFVAGDLTRREGLEALTEGVDAVFHVAGIHDYSTPDRLIFAVNVDGVENVCSAAVASGVQRLVHVSSVGVYGFGWHSGEPVAEDAGKLTGPRCNYNVSKWEGEQIVQRYAGEGKLEATIFRPGAIYGPRSEYGLALVFHEVLKSRDKRRLLMAGEGKCIEAFLNVDDMAAAMIFALQHEETVGEVYNIADESRLTTVEFFELVSRELLGETRDFLHVPLGVLGPVAAISQLLSRLFGGKPFLERGTLHYLGCDKVWDTTKLRGTGFELQHPRAEVGLPATLAWYRDNGWLRSA